MSDWTRILCAVERDRDSHALIDAAASLAKKLGAELTLVHVVNTGSPGAIVAPPERLTGLLAEAAMPLRELASVAAGALGTPVQVRVEHGQAANEIVRVARESASDLLMLGTRGRHGLGRALFGSVADKVARDAPCPVIVVRLP